MLESRHPGAETQKAGAAYPKPLSAARSRLFAPPGHRLQESNRRDRRERKAETHASTAPGVSVSQVEVNQ